MKNQAILVTGGAGYIGSVIVHEFLMRGYEVVVIDKAVLRYALPKQSFDGLLRMSGERDKDSKNNISFPAHPECPSQLFKSVEGRIEGHQSLYFFQSDYADTKTLEKIFTTFNICAVIHCAAFIDVGGSVRDPLSYYENNVAKTITLLQIMRAHNVHKIIFSSSCAVYGIPQQLPLTEDHPKNPVSPYGQTKLMVEHIMRDAAHAYGLQFVALRYFNAAGALPEKNLGECHEPETHVIPLLLRAAYEQKTFTIFGNDYHTADGTCVRDFLHVRDIAHAHIKAVDYLMLGGVSDSFNVGTGSGFSVQHMVREVEKITGKSVRVVYAARRAGDPDTLVADASKAEHILSWRPQCSDIFTIIFSAAQFYVAMHAVAGSISAQREMLVE